MHIAPAAMLSAAVTILALLFVFFTGGNVARLRGKHKIMAPAVSGHPEFDRAYRIQMNTLEQFVIFLPLLWLATLLPWTRLGWLPALFGLIWIVGRAVYMQGYMKDPEKRGPGFGITQLAHLGLLVLAIGGVVTAWSALQV